MASNEFANDENISGGAETFTGATLSSTDYEGGIQDISILPGRAQQMNEPLTESAQFKLRSELGKVIRIAIIARPGVTHDASASVQTFETMGGPIVNPIDFEELDDVNVARAASAANYPHMRGFEEYVVGV